VFGTAVGWMAAGLLSINVVQVWFGRYPVAEPMSQFLVFLALWAFALWEERGSPAFGLLAGTALGLTLLVRIDNVLVLVPLGLYLLVRRAQGSLPWSRARVILLPVLLLTGHALVHGAFWARKYVLSVVNRPYWEQPWWVWLAGAAGAAAGLLVAHRFEPRVVRWIDAHGALARRGLIAGLVLLALYAYFLRPLLSIWAGGDGNTRPPLAHRGAFTALGFHHLAAHDAQSLVRLGWFVTWPVLILAVAGCVWLLRRWEGRWLFPMLVAGTYSLFYLYKIRIYNDYYFAMRRFMPVVIPSLLALAAVALVALWARGRAGRILSGLLAAVIAVLFLRDTLPLATYRDWRNSVRFVDDMARRFGPQDVVIFEQKGSVHLLRRTGTAFQQDALFGSMTIADNVALPLRELTRLPEPVIGEMVRMRLARVGLAGLEQRRPAQLSGGQRKRAALARASILDPELMFCDEPSAGLDPVVAAGIDDTLLEFCATLGITLVVVTHELASIRAIADRAVMFGDGELRAAGTIDELSRSRDPDVYGFFHRVADQGAAPNGRRALAT